MGIVLESGCKSKLHVLFMRFTLCMSCNLRDSVDLNESWLLHEPAKQYFMNQKCFTRDQAYV